MQLFLLSHFTSQDYGVMGRSSTPLELLRRTSQKKLVVSQFLIPREAESRTCAGECVVTTCRKNRLCRSIRLTRITLVAEKLPSLKYFALFFAEVKEFWLCSCGEGIVFLSLFLMGFTVQFSVNWESIENSIVLQKHVGQVKQQEAFRTQ